MEFETFKNELGWAENVHSHLVFDFYSKVGEFAAGKVVLDVGAGYQPYLPFFEKSLYLALEHQESGVIKKNIVDAHIIVAGNDIPLRDNSVDAIFSTSSLEHFEEPDKFFRESARVLKPGGGLFIQVPYMYEEHETPFHFQHFTRFGLHRLFSINGFDKVQVLPSSSSMYAAEYLLHVALHDDFPQTDHSGKSGIRLLKGKVINLRRRGALAVMQLGLGLVTRGADLPPSERTRMPIGFLAEGFKSGENIPSNYSNSDHERFLSENVLESLGYRFQNKRIVSVKD